MRSGYVRYHDDLEPLMVPIDDVRQHPSNYNNGDVEAIVRSIMEVGMYRPVIVNTEGEILAGNHTWQACKQLGAERIPVIRVPNDTEAENIKLMVADNRTAALAKPDYAQLLDLLTDLAASDSIEGTGYDEQDMAQIEKLCEMKYDPEDDIASWPVLHLQVPPHLMKAYHDLTSEAETEKDAFELLLRLAGWQS